MKVKCCVRRTSDEQKVIKIKSVYFRNSHLPFIWWQLFAAAFHPVAFDAWRDKGTRAIYNRNYLIRPQDFVLSRDIEEDSEIYQKSRSMMKAALWNFYFRSSRIHRRIGQLILNDFRVMSGGKEKWRHSQTLVHFWIFDRVIATSLKMDTGVNIINWLDKCILLCSQPNSDTQPRSWMLIGKLPFRQSIFEHGVMTKYDVQTDFIKKTSTQNVP